MQAGIGPLTPEGALCFECVGLDFDSTKSLCDLLLYSGPFHLQHLNVLWRANWGYSLEVGVGQPQVPHTLYNGGSATRCPYRGVLYTDGWVRWCFHERIIHHYNDFTSKLYQLGHTDLSVSKTFMSLTISECDRAWTT